MKLTVRTFVVSMVILSGITAGGTASAASIALVDMFRNNAFVQTGNGNTLASAGSFLSLELQPSGTTAYDAAAVTYPGPGSPQSLTLTGPVSFSFQTAFFANQAAMDAAYPTGTYSFNATNSVTSANDTATLAYSVDDYVTNAPFLTGTDFTALQGLNPASPFTLHFSPFVSGPADASFEFLSIFDNTLNKFVVLASFLPTSTTSLLLPANTLAANHSFTYELDYSNRVFPGGVTESEIGFEVRTSGQFRTSDAAAPVPEPATMTLVGLGILGVAHRARRSRW